MLAHDFRKNEINYVRKKTKNTKEGEFQITFAVPDEAKPLIEKYMDKTTGKIVFGKRCGCVLMSLVFKRWPYVCLLYKKSHYIRYP